MQAAAAASSLACTTEGQLALPAQWSCHVHMQVCVSNCVYSPVVDAPKSWTQCPAIAIHPVPVVAGLELHLSMCLLSQKFINGVMGFCSSP